MWCRSGMDCWWRQLSEDENTSCPDHERPNSCTVAPLPSSRCHILEFGGFVRWAVATCIILCLHFYGILIHACSSLLWKRSWKESRPGSALKEVLSPPDTVPVIHCWLRVIMQVITLPAPAMRPAGGLRLIFLKMGIWDQLGQMPRPCSSNVLVLGFQALTVLKADCSSGREKAFATCIHTLTQKVLHVEAGGSTAYLYRLKILFHLGKIMSFSNLHLFEQER